MTGVLTNSEAVVFNNLSKPRYIHKPLNIGESSFRLVRILPRDDLEHVRCEVINTDLDSAPTYKALSYVWGPPTPVQDIEINGSSLSVRQNLWDLLDLTSTEADSDSWGWYFIDQLCIDQENTLERNEQVHEMARIYRNAEEVVIWIMPGNPIDRDWFETLDLEDSLLRVAAREKLKELMENDYWGRLWVFQEVVLGKLVMLRWGRAVCAFRDCPWLYDVGIDSDVARNMRSLVLARMSFSMKKKMNWSGLAVDAGNRLCEDPRDQVYAMLGLVGETTLWPDYSKSVEEVFQDWVREALSKETMPREVLWSCFQTWRQRMKLPPEEISEELMRTAAAYVC